MKNYYFTLLAFCFGMTAQSQTISIPDSNFKNMLVSASTSNLIAADASGTFIKIDANNDGEIQVEEAMLVKKLQFNGFTYVDQLNVAMSVVGLEYFDNVEEITFDDKYIPLLDVRGMTGLKYITTGAYMKFDMINASGSTSIIRINTTGSKATSIDISNCTSIKELICANSRVMSLNLSGAVNLEKLVCAQNTTLPALNLSGLSNLQTLNCDGLYYITELDFSPLTNIKTIECSKLRSMTALDFSGLAHLEKIDFSDSSHNNASDGRIQSINLNGVVSLKSLSFDNNIIHSLDLSGYTNLEYLSCENNNITSMNLQGAVNLKELNCRENFLTSIDLSNQALLEKLGIEYNKITTLDVSQTSHLQILHCYGNPLLESLFMKNGGNEALGANNSFYFSFCPNLRYICADETELAAIQHWATVYGMTNCQINSYCSFAPGGTNYVIAGDSRFDWDANGCDTDDVHFPYMKYSITDGTYTGTLIANPSGSYILNVKAGTHTMTPILENPTYFTVSPITATITFPTEASPFTQDFCVTANGVHPDAEVNIVPIGIARPGFDCDYKIIYKNKGNQTLSGVLSFAYNAAVLQFVGSDVAPSTQPMNYINWNFTNLKPFETKEIIATFNLNSPLEVPPVNSGFILNYTLCVNTGSTDETPDDNIFVINQTVVNSMDPNDKTCLEGRYITPDKIGKYVHYMIRFENSGTAEAKNIVVKDMIDMTKYDIASLEPLDGSHPFITKISEGNKVEFIFEDINLPFDDATNDGYVSFKIKTASDMATGDSFSNTAAIYFDYNAPIITDPAVTSVVPSLANDNFDFASHFSLAPNPAKDVLNIAVKGHNQITSVSLYNTLGQLVMTVSNPAKAIDVSGLKTGSYVVKIVSEQGKVQTKFIKE